MPELSALLLSAVQRQTFHHNLLHQAKLAAVHARRRTCWTISSATSCKLVDGRLGVDSAFAVFLLPLVLAPGVAFALTGVFAAGFKAAVEVELAPVPA